MTLLYLIVVIDNKNDGEFYKEKILSQKMKTGLPHQQAGLSINEIDPPAGEVNYILPIRLNIPDIYSNSSIEYVGITENGEMGVPKKIENVGLYQFGPQPGKIGNAVIAGHYGWKDGKSAAFDDLYKLKVGNIIYIDDTNGKRISFIVREIRTYDWNADTTDVFVSNDGNSHLNLITCNGEWSKATENYSKRLVVFTDKIDK